MSRTRCSVECWEAWGFRKIFELLEWAVQSVVPRSWKKICFQEQGLGLESFRDWTAVASAWAKLTEVLDGP